MGRFGPRRNVAWIALWALVLATLAPSLAALAGTGARDGGFHVELCTEAGMVRIAVGEADAAGHGEELPGDRSTLPHCPLCATHACVPPTADGRAALPAPVGEARAPYGDDSARGPGRLAWTPAHPRAPPPAA